MLVFIGLGGNVGDPAETMASAVAALGSVGSVRGASSLYASAPRDLLDQPGFVNDAVALETELDPRQLLAKLKSIERVLGRDLGGTRYGPRVIDLDILAIEGRCVADEDVGLVVPHPRLHERRFALAPLAEIDPNLRPWANCDDPRADVTVGHLLPSVADQEVRRVAGPEWRMRER